MNVNDIRALCEKDYGNVSFPPDNMYETYKVNNRFTIFVGPPGSGKTSKATSMSTLSISCFVYDATDMKYLFKNLTYDGVTKTSSFQHSALWKAIENGETVLFDEIDALTDDTISLLIQLTESDTGYAEIDGEEIKVNPEFKIIATISPKTQFKF